MTIVAIILRTLISAIMAVLTVIAPGISAFAPNELLDSENCLLNFVAISDTHFETSQYNQGNAIYSDLTHNLYLHNIGSSATKPDALVIAGDITDHGYLSQWEKTEETLASYDLADEIILAMGNHDLWTRDETGRTSKGLFLQFNKRITGKYVSNVYYSTEVNGYPFIILCSESDDTHAYISNKQIKWLKAEMKKAAEKDLPIFVICHWPVNQTHGLPVTWGEDDYDDMTGGLGEQSKKVEKILKKYDNVFYINGHIHNGFSNESMEPQTGFQTVESDGSFHSINLPRVNAISHTGFSTLCAGYNVEVYEDQVVFRARNYLANTWMPKYDYTIDLV